MIKIVFLDLDDTIIRHEADDIKLYSKVLEQYGYDPNDYQLVYNAIDEYEASLTEEEPFYDINGMIDFINKKYNKNYTCEFAYSLLETIEKEWGKKENVIIPESIMKYLSSKYDLYIYTNFYQEVQEKRIDNIGYRKYFKKLFGADKYGVKPYASSFRRVINEVLGKESLTEEEYRNVLDEIIYIGDSKRSDIAFSKNIGIRSVLYDETGERDKVDIDLGDYKYDVIHNWDEITKIL